jgi:hypothetical protein
MFRIAATQLFANVLVRPFPEAAQIACCLYGPPVWREEHDQDRFLTRADSRCVGEPEQFLKLDRRANRSIFFLGELRGSAARYGNRLGCQPLELMLHLPAESIGESDLTERAAALAGARDERWQVRGKTGKAQAA